MNHYTKINMGINAWHGSTGHCFSFSAFWNSLWNCSAIILGKKTMSEAKSKMAYAGFWIGKLLRLQLE